MSYDRRYLLISSQRNFFSFVHNKINRRLNIVVVETCQIMLAHRTTLKCFSRIEFHSRTKKFVNGSFTERYKLWVYSSFQSRKEYSSWTEISQSFWLKWGNFMRLCVMCILLVKLCIFSKHDFRASPQIK